MTSGSRIRASAAVGSGESHLERISNAGVKVGLPGARHEHGRHSACARPLHLGSEVRIATSGPEHQVCVAAGDSQVLPP